MDTTQYCHIIGEIQSSGNSMNQASLNQDKNQDTIITGSPPTELEVILQVWGMPAEQNGLYRL